MITAEAMFSCVETIQKLLWFKKQFPNGFEVTEDNCVRYALDFDWLSMAEHFLSRLDVTEFCQNTLDAQTELDTVMGIINPKDGPYRYFDGENSDLATIYEKGMTEIYEKEARMFARLYQNNHTS